MALDKFKYTPETGWMDPAVFKTDPDSENDARAMLQELHNQTREYINQLIDKIETSLGADLGFEAVDGLDAVKVRAAFVELLAKFASYVALSAVEQTLTSDPDKIPSSKAVSDAMVAGGLGDMLSSVYAQNPAPGVVDHAVTADMLDGVEADLYATKGYVSVTLGQSMPTNVSELTNDSGYQTNSGGVAQWIGTNGTSYLLRGICTREQYDADAGNPNRARTVYWVPIA